MNFYAQAHAIRKALREKPMQKYLVTIQRVVVETVTVEVEAENEEAAWTVPVSQYDGRDWTFERIDSRSVAGVQALDA